MIGAEAVLDSLVDITQQKEETPLAFSLITSIRQVLGSEMVILADRRVVRDESVIVVVAAEGVLVRKCLSNQKQLDELVSSEFGALIEQCHKSKVPGISGTDTSRTGVFPVYRDESVNYMLCIKDRDWSDKAASIVYGMAQVFRNYLVTISESEHDTLTGLLNRKCLHEKISKTIESSRTISRKNEGDTERRIDNISQSYWLCIFDIDHFKRINDKLGHLFGDEVLVLIGRMMKKFFRKEDLLFRYGGEEFIAVVGPNSKESATKLLNRFREKLAKRDFSSVGQVTVSMGLVEVVAGHTPTVTVGHADQALYYAKDNGRNQLGIYEDLIAENKIQRPEMSDDAELF
jgi:diguanylate cyclase (GGDEF)-like protein